MSKHFGAIFTHPHHFISHFDMTLFFNPSTEVKPRSVCASYRPYSPSQLSFKLVASICLQLNNLNLRYSDDLVSLPGYLRQIKEYGPRNSDF